MKNGSHDEIFQQYHVKCIIGLFNPEIEGIPFISLEDIISMNSAEKLTNIFSEYLDEEQMEKVSKGQAPMPQMKAAKPKKGKGKNKGGFRF